MGHEHVLYEGAVLIDSAAVVALFDPKDGRHADAHAFLDVSTDVKWYVINSTSHESFTRLRYNASLAAAIDAFVFLRDGDVQVLAFTEADEEQARATLKKYRDHRLSFHDALCYAVALRVGLFKVFTFDRDFMILGMQLVPGLF